MRSIEPHHRSGHALVPWYRGDNAGPPSASQVEATFAQLQKEAGPNVRVIASTFDAFVDVLDTVRDKLPQVTSEIADTWIYGAQADPLKQAQSRAVMRARTKCEKLGLTIFKYNSNFYLISS